MGGRRQRRGMVVVGVHREEARAGGVQPLEGIVGGPALVDSALRRAGAHSRLERAEDVERSVGEEVVARDERALGLHDPIRVEEGLRLRFDLGGRLDQAAKRDVGGVAPLHRVEVAIRIVGQHESVAEGRRDGVVVRRAVAVSVESRVVGVIGFVADHGPIRDAGLRQHLVRADQDDRAELGQPAGVAANVIDDLVDLGHDFVRPVDRARLGVPPGERLAGRDLGVIVDRHHDAVRLIGELFQLGDRGRGCRFAVARRHTARSDEIERFRRRGHALWIRDLMLAAERSGGAGRRRRGRSVRAADDIRAGLGSAVVADDLGDEGLPSLLRRHLDARRLIGCAALDRTRPNGEAGAPQRDVLDLIRRDDRFIGRLVATILDGCPPQRRAAQRRASKSRRLRPGLGPVDHKVVVAGQVGQRDRRTALRRGEGERIAVRCTRDVAGEQCVSRLEGAPRPAHPPDRGSRPPCSSPRSSRRSRHRPGR